MISRSRIATYATYCPPVPNATYEPTLPTTPQTTHPASQAALPSALSPAPPPSAKPPSNDPTIPTQTQPTQTSPSSPLPPPPPPLPPPAPQAPPPAPTPQEHTHPQTHPAQTSDATRTLPGPGRARMALHCFLSGVQQQKTQAPQFRPDRKGSALRTRTAHRERDSWGTAGRRGHERIRRRGRR